MKLKHLPRSYLSAPLLLTLLAACGGGAGGGTSPANLFPDNGSQPGASSLQPARGATQADSQITRPGNHGNAAGTGNTTNTGNAGSGTGTNISNASSGGTTSAAGGNGAGNNTATPAGPLKVSPKECPLQYEVDSSQRRAESAGADPQEFLQWHLKNTGSLTGYAGMKSGEDLRVTGVWNQGVDGHGVRVAVIDDALLLMHEDLRANVVPGSHNYRKTANGTSDGHADYPVPCTSEEAHGTSVAGVIAARNGNGVGMVGVAPHASLVGLNALVTEQEADKLDALVRDLDKNHIYSNSWGNQDWGHFFGYENASAHRDALERGLSTGRGGLGSIYVFAGGNGADKGDYSLLDGYVGERGVVTVCATNAAGERAFYSERGPNLTVCAPSAEASEGTTLPGVATTTVGTDNEEEGTKGTDLNLYTDTFNGTSAAAPMVSGVVALMLQANSKLTWRDVPLILARTARKVDEENGQWKDYSSPIRAASNAWNTLHYSHSYGFGVANAEDAVKLARDWQSVGGSSTQKKCVVRSVSVNQPIPEAGTTFGTNRDKGQGLDGTARLQLLAVTEALDYNQAVTDGISSTAEVDSTCAIRHIEHIDVKVNFTDDAGSGQHPSMGDLQMTLQSPLGTVSTLTVPHACQSPYLKKDGTQGIVTSLCNEPGDGFQYGVRRHLEEPVANGSNRTWTLSVVDRVTGHTGRLKDWSITFYGR
ncbi:serine protease [Lautropia dentalis]|uniref:Serine protease n=1 Tax=Lautropia dentalis TaxID=2490857 RepID=A0A426FQM1_9BURK|nr:S8 family serine peptidase [Lautropia dentalis]RRN44975.1 serine protease [Lautropia dentalis]